MAEEKKNSPKLRFREFTGDNANAWELRKLGEIAKITTGKLDANAMDQDGIYDFYTSGIKKYHINSYSFEGPAITIAGNGATVGYMHLADGKFDAYQRTYVLTDFDGNRQYLFENIGLKLPKKIKQESRTGNIPYIVLDMLTKLLIDYPSINEQQKIGSFFKYLDELITLHQRMLDEYKTLKKTMLSKMFPKNSEKYPELRFSGFTDAWELRKLGEIAKITTGKLDANAMDQDGIYDFYTSGIKKYHINSYSFEGPAITIAGNGATVGYMHLADGKFDAYQRTYVLTDFDGNRQYLFENIGLKLPKKIKQESRTGNIPYIVLDMLTKLLIDYPSINEQQKIGSFFKYLDELITLHQRELELLKTLKKTMLQQMFV